MTLVYFTSYNTILSAKEGCMRRFLAWAKEEIILATPGIIFFAITFNLINLTEKLMFKPIGYGYVSFTTATIGALVVGKLIIIANSLPFINAFPNKPLIYNIVWKFFIYGSLTLLFRVLEKGWHLAFHYDNMTIVLQLLKVTLSSPSFWAVQIWVLMLFAIYIVFSEYIRCLGKKKVLQLLLG